MSNRLDPAHLQALIKASLVESPKRVEYDLEHFLVEGYERSTSRIVEADESEPIHHEPSSEEEDLRQWLSNHKKLNQISLHGLALGIGIKRHTLVAFLKSQAKPQPRTIHRIRLYKQRQAHLG